MFEFVSCDLWGDVTSARLEEKFCDFTPKGGIEL